MTEQEPSPQGRVGRAVLYGFLMGGLVGFAITLIYLALR